MNPLDFLRTYKPKIPLIIKTVLPSGAVFAYTQNLELPCKEGDTITDFYISAKTHKSSTVSGKFASPLKPGDFILGEWKDYGARSIDPKTRASSNNGELKSFTGIDHAVFTHETMVLRLNLLLAERQDASLFTPELCLTLRHTLDHANGLAEESVLNLIDAAMKLQEEVRAAFQQATRQTREAEVLKADLDTKAAQLDDHYRKIREGLEEREECVADAEAGLARLYAEENRLSARLARLSPVIASLIPRDEEVPTPPVRDLSELMHEAGKLNTPLLGRALLMTILLSSLTGTLGLLHGSVGVGKTYSARRMGKAMGAAFDLIPVRPSWVEPADLLGYFDPLASCFRAGPLAEALTRPCPPDQIRLLCLDELNLARIENYAADLLSRLEYAKQADNHQECIPLYADSDFAGLVHELESLSNLSLSPDQQRRLTVLQRSLPQYPSRLRLPQGMALIGTLNADETTYELSPKVIDRAYCISFPNQDPSAFAGQNGLSETTPELSREAAGTVHFSLLRKAWLTAADDASTGRLWQQLISALPIASFSDICSPLGRRLYADFHAACALGRVLGLKEQDLLAFFAWTKILPRINYRPDSRRNHLLRRMLDQLGDLCGPGDEAWQHTRQGFLNQINDPSAPVIKYFRAAG